MPEQRSSPGPLIPLLLAMILAGWQPVLADGSTAPSPDHADALVDLSGHWAAADLGSIDVVQDGASLRGRSPEGVVIRGTVRGQRATFTFWHGPTYRKADKEDRGSGSIDLSPDGRFITVTWDSEAGGGKYDGSMVAIRVVPIGGGPDPVTESDGEVDATGAEGLPGITTPGGDGVDALEGALADTGLTGLGATTAASIQATIGAIAAVGQATLAADTSTGLLAQYEGYPNLFQAGMSMLSTTPANEAAAYLSRLAASLKQQYERYESAAAEAHQARDIAVRTLELAHDALVAARQDVRLYEWRLGEAQRAAASADSQVAEAGVILSRAQAAAADAATAAQDAQTCWQAAAATHEAAKAALADAGPGAAVSLKAALDAAAAAQEKTAAAYQAAADWLEEVEAIVQHDIAAYGSLALDATELHQETILFQRAYDRAVAAVPAALARRFEAQGDYLVRNSTAVMLAESARVTYVNYDQAYWAAVNAWRKVTK
jgi:hypothetical protein